MVLGSIVWGFSWKLTHGDTKRYCSDALLLKSNVHYSYLFSFTYVYLDRLYLVHVLSNIISVNFVLCSVEYN